MQSFSTKKIKQKKFKFNILVYFIFSIFITPSSFALDVTDGCQGEGCGCFSGYYAAYTEEKAPDFELETIEPFTLYKELKKTSQVLGHFKTGVKAKPIGYKMIFLQPGEHIVIKNENKQYDLNKKDKVTRLVYDGEGWSSVLKGEKRISFKKRSVQLKTIKKTRIEEWLEISINGMKGYSPRSPFEGCSH